MTERVLDPPGLARRRDSDANLGIAIALMIVFFIVGAVFLLSDLSDEGVVLRTVRLRL